MPTSLEEVTREALTLSNEERSQLTHTLLESLQPSKALGDHAEALARRREMTHNFVTGQWVVDLSGYEQARKADRTEAQAQTGRD